MNRQILQYHMTSLQLRKIKIKVISSIIELFLDHDRVAMLSRLSDACWICLFSQQGMRDRMIYSFDRNQKTPSDPITTILSLWVSVNYLIYGMGLTPIEAPTRSPKLRVMANPGAFQFCSQTLRGPMDQPRSSLQAQIRPRIFLILSASFQMLGLWSLERGTASQLFSLNLPRIARLSPTFAQQSLFCWKYTLITVEPEKFMSIFNYLSIFSQANSKTLWMLSLGVLSRVLELMK